MAVYRRIGLLFAAALVGVVLVGYASCPPTGYGLTAGQYIGVGTVTVSNDDANIYVDYEVNDPWTLEDTHLDISAFPHTGRLSPGRCNGNQYETGLGHYVIPYDMLNSCGDKVYLQIHAAVSMYTGEADEYEEPIVIAETAYGGTITQPNRGAWYGDIAYTICCDSGDPDPLECQTETAFGGNAAGAGNAWWFYYTGSGSQTIWAGQTINVGSVTVSGGTIAITLTGGWGLQGVNEPVKIKGYDVLPDGRPAAGQFTGTGTYKGENLSVDVGVYAFYVIHLDVQLCQ